jgi:hypothetical protein
LRRAVDGPAAVLVEAVEIKVVVAVGAEAL